jgi:hypothetical protein
MKKKILFLLAFSAGCASLYAQTGNVGIGTTTPIAKLHVKASSGNNQYFRISDPNDTTRMIVANRNSISNANTDLILTPSDGSSTLTLTATPGVVVYDVVRSSTNLSLQSIGTVQFRAENDQYEFTSGTGAPVVARLWNGNLGLGLNFTTETMGARFDVKTATTDTSKALRVRNAADVPLLTTLSNGNVGIGTDAPASKLHVAGGVQIVDGTQGAGKLFVSNAAGLGSWQDPAQTKEIMALGNATSQSVLTASAAGTSVALTNFTQMVNTITGASFNTGTDVVTLPVGTYEMSVSYELTATGTCPAAGFLINSYFIDFPNNGGTMRVHSNAPSICGGNSIHSALWVTTVVIPAGGQNWTVQIGRGVGGNYADVATVSNTSRILIKKIL